MKLPDWQHVNQSPQYFTTVMKDLRVPRAVSPQGRTSSALLIQLGHFQSSRKKEGEEGEDAVAAVCRCSFIVILCRSEFIYLFIFVVCIWPGQDKKGRLHRLKTTAETLTVQVDKRSENCGNSPLRRRACRTATVWQSGQVWVLTLRLRV